MLNVNMAYMSKAILESIINIVYPSVCASCNKPNYQNQNGCYICNECYFKIKRHIPPYCKQCGRGLMEIKNISRGICSTCLNRQYYFQEAWSICSYEGIIKELIHKFKYNQKIQYETIFKDLLHEFFGAFKILRDIDVIVPVPLHSVKLREREYNQSQILASIVSGILQKPMIADALIRIRNTKPQIDLHERDRIKNISGCFVARNSSMLGSKSILIIDDVLTTGTTLSEAAKVIKESKPSKISVLTLAS